MFLWNLIWTAQSADPNPSVSAYLCSFLFFLFQVLISQLLSHLVLIRCCFAALDASRAHASMAHRLIAMGFAGRLSRRIRLMDEGRFAVTPLSGGLNAEEVKEGTCFWGRNAGFGKEDAILYLEGDCRLVFV